MMKKLLITFLSALILLSYGFFSHKYTFIGLGIVFVIIGLADLLQPKK